MTYLTLGLLGPMQVMRNGQPTVTFPYEKVRALLTYLATESHYPHHRDRLAALLWADQCGSKARSNLRKALSTLRHLLDDRTTDSSLFLSTRNTIQFNAHHSQCKLDVTIFTQLLEQHQYLHQTDQLHLQCVFDLEQAVALYRGSFLDQMQLPYSDAFEEWVLLRREHFQQLAVNACVDLIRHYEHQQDDRKVKYYIQRQLQFEPWNEAYHQRLIELLARQGQRASALRQYERCCKMLERELATEPECATVALGAAIRSGKFHAVH